MNVNDRDPNPRIISMALRKRWGRASAVSLASIGLLIGLGCGGDEFQKRYPVSGKVTYKGEPVKKGSITFTPDSKEGRAANGNLVDGSYTLTTHSPNDGALPGKYRVSIIAKEPDEGAFAKTTGHPNQVDTVKSYIQAKPLIPRKYELADTSGLTAEVKEQPNQVDFDLAD
jgi:hypothetical protein